MAQVYSAEHIRLDDRIEEVPEGIFWKFRRFAGNISSIYVHTFTHEKIDEVILTGNTCVSAL